MTGLKQRFDQVADLNDFIPALTDDDEAAHSSIGPLARRVKDAMEMMEEARSEWNAAIADVKLAATTELTNIRAGGVYPAMVASHTLEDWISVRSKKYEQCRIQLQAVMTRLEPVLEVLKVGFVLQ